MQSSFSFHCSPDHSAILRSIRCEDTFDLPAAAAVLPEPQRVAQLVAVAALLGEQVHQHIADVAAVVAAAELDTSSLAHDSAVAAHIGYVESESNQERLQPELQTSFAVAVLLEELGPERDASAGEVEFADFAFL